MTTDQDTVEEYTEALIAGCNFPPIVVFFDGLNYWPADGWHRIKAHVAADMKTILADVQRGDERAAILYAVGTNRKHGLKRLPADKRRAVSMLLTDSEWSQWSAKKIADQCGVGPTLVNEMRKEMIALSSREVKIDHQKHRENCNPGLQIDHSPPATVKVSRGDSVYEMRVGNIGNRDGGKVEKRCPYCRQTITE